VSRLRFSQDGKTLASGSWDGTVKLWDDPPRAGEWRPRATLTGPDFTVNDLAFRPDGKVLAFTTNDSEKANVWLADVGSGKVVGSCRSGRAATAVAFSADGRWLATGNLDGRLEVWDANQLLAAPKK
jgi:WD40 repeat protein